MGGGAIQARPPQLLAAAVNEQHNAISLRNMAHKNFEMNVARDGDRSEHMYRQEEVAVAGQRKADKGL